VLDSLVLPGRRGVADQPIGFELTPHERFLVGVTYSPPTLRLRPTLPQRLRGAALAVAGVVAIAVIVGSALSRRSADDLTLAVVSISTIAAATVAGAGMWWTVVEATPSGLSERRLWRRRSWTWSQIRKVTAMDFRPSGWTAGSEPSVSWRAKPETTTPLLVLSDRSTYSLELLTTTSRRDGFSLGDPSAAEVYAALLERYRLVVTRPSDAVESASATNSS